MASIIARELGIEFQQRPLFSGANLRFAEGDCIYLMGDNGTGKTTLMKILAGLQSPSAGSVSTDGFAAKGYFQKSKLHGCAMYLHQHPYLFEGTVTDNLLLALNIAKTSADDLAIAKVLELAKLSHLANSQASNLSGGERQRLSFARALLLKPRLLMLDEPVSNMDKTSRELVVNMASELKACGTGLLITSHQHGELTAMCNSHWLIQDGRIITDLDVCFTPSQETPYVLAN